MKKKGNHLTRIAVIFLCALMVATLTTMFRPGFVTAYAEENEEEMPDKGTLCGIDARVIGSPKNVSANEPWTGSYLWFGKTMGNPVKYRILSPYNVSYGSRTMFVDCDSVIGAQLFYYNNYIPSTDYAHNDWTHSYLRKHLNSAFLNSNNFTTAEIEALAESTLSGRELRVGSGNFYVSSETAAAYRYRVPLTGEKVFVLDVEEASNPAYGYNQATTALCRQKNTLPNLNNRSEWVLRNAYYEEDESSANRVAYNVGTTLMPASVESAKCFSPAFNIDLSSIVLVSDDPDTYGEYGTEYKLTLVDEAINVSLTGDTPPLLTADGVQIYYTVKGFNAEKVNRLSVLIINKPYTPGNTNDADFRYYEELTLQGTSSFTKGLGTFRLPSNYPVDQWGRTYHVYLLAEDVNGLHETDYCSAPLELVLSDEPIVTFHPNGGVFEDDIYLTVQGTQIQIPALSPTKAGYWFCGWSPLLNASFGTLQKGSTYTPSGDERLFAIWKELDYTGTTLTAASEESVSFSEGTAILPYTLSGPDASRVSRVGVWILDKTFRTDNANNAKLLYAETFKINSASGTISFALPTGYSAYDWGTEYQVYLSAVGSAGTPVSNMAPLHPKWAHTLSFDLNGGTSGAPADVYGVTVTIPKSNPIRDGYWFLGWALVPDATSAHLKSGSDVSLLRDTVVYAVWKQKSVTNCKLMFNLNGGTGTAPATITAASGTAVTVPKASVSRTGYYFLGWSTSSTATTATYKSGSVITLTKDMTLYAVWKAASVTKYTLSFDRNGGSGNAPAKITAASGTTVTIPKCSVSREGHYFMGWSTTRGGAVAYKSGDTLKLTKDTVLYAVWKAKNVTLQYNVNGGSGTTPAKVTTTYGSTVTVQKSSVSRSGYWFLGWSTSATATTATYKTGSTLTLKDNVTLYAVWKKQ